jgi:hypothetical protein
MVLGTAIADKPADGTTGSGAPKAKKLYSMNIIGVPKDKTADMDGTQGHTIFVKLNGKSKILLCESGIPGGCAPDDEFVVLDRNGTDGDGALFALPDPDLDPYVVGDEDGADTMSAYSVFVRPLGKPGGWATITTCAQLLDSDFAGLLPGKFVKTLNNECEWDGALASIEQVGQEITLRTTGKKVFQNVTAELLTIVLKVEVDISAEGDDPEIIIVCVRVPIFDDIIQGEYWEYDNHGLKILQVRFYDIETDVSADDSDLDCS